MCILAELILSLAGSNSDVEHGFSMLTNTLMNRHLKMSHSTLENLILIRCNDGIWLDYQRKKIIQQAADIHLTKQKKLRVDSEETSNQLRKLHKMLSERMKKKVIIPQQRKQILVLTRINLFSLCSKVFKTDCVCSTKKKSVFFYFFIFLCLNKIFPKSLYARQTSN